jgi:hypothetical protein
MTEEKKQFVPELTLTIHARIPIDEEFEGDQLYDQLKEIIVNYCGKSSVHGEIHKMLEPCCNDQKPSGT